MDFDTSKNCGSVIVNLAVSCALLSHSLKSDVILR